MAQGEKIKGSRNKTGLLLLVVAIFVVAGVVAAMFSDRPAPPGKEQQTTNGQSVDPKTVGGANDPRPR
jgi:hypothetical protein